MTAAPAPPARDTRVGIAALREYPERIDVRSPSEYALDHIPGAVSAPVLSDEERAHVGTMHAQVSQFAAKRAGAAIVARNIAHALETVFADKPRTWAPLVYCWRGGKRSGALTHILNEIGWRAVQLEGGYRTYRRHVVERLRVLPATFSYRVICGLTGSGKSRLVQALREEGAQALDLEALANHRGSLLGDLPDCPQPSQKAFETRVLDALERFDASRPVYVESESKRIGTLQVPQTLLDAMRGASCITLQTPRALRVELLRDEYAHFLRDPAALSQRLLPLVELHGRKTIDEWSAWADAGDWDTLIDALLARHYDPTYARSIERNFPRAPEARVVAPSASSPAAFRALAREIDPQECRSPAPSPA